MKTKAIIWGLRISNSRYMVLGSDPNTVALGSEALGFLKTKCEGLYTLFTKNFGWCWRQKTNLG